jgi:hypothetical protein
MELNVTNLNWEIWNIYLPWRLKIKTYTILTCSHSMKRCVAFNWKQHWHTLWFMRSKCNFPHHTPACDDGDSVLEPSVVTILIKTYTILHKRAEIMKTVIIPSHSVRFKNILPWTLHTRQSTQNLLISFKPIICKLTCSHSMKRCVAFNWKQHWHTLWFMRSKCNFQIDGGENGLLLSYQIRSFVVQ